MHKTQRCSGCPVGLYVSFSPYFSHALAFASKPQQFLLKLLKTDEGIIYLPFFFVITTSHFRYTYSFVVHLKGVIINTKTSSLVGYIDLYKFTTKSVVIKQ